LRPTAIVSGRDSPVAGDRSHLLAGGPLGFEACEVVLREGHDPPLRIGVTIDEVRAWADALDAAAGDRVRNLLTRLGGARRKFLGFALDRPLILGIVNVTPDSFSDGGDHPDTSSAVAHARSLVAAGADILDIGGESTRPGAERIPETEELERVLPVIEILAGDGVPISIDTRRARVMAAAVAAGARMINDTSALTGDPASLETAAESGVPVVLMHSRGEPRTMREAAGYEDALLDVYDELEERVEASRRAGIKSDRLVVDPGIGFAKNTEHNFGILRGLALYHGLGCALMLGVSRKLGVGAVPSDRVPASVAGALWGISQGAQILRVHDVAETRLALRVWQAIGGAATPNGDKD
jgi:dihydropteroate synthase